MEGTPYPWIPGVKFQPKEYHLILHYLAKKVRGEPLAWDGITDFDVYGEKGPWEILHSDGGTVYFFATSKMKNASMKQRTCAFGTWKLQQNNYRVVDEKGRGIGSRAYLSFYPDDENVNPLMLGGNWNMYEYSLPGSEKKECPVICKLSFKAWTEKERGWRVLEMQEGSSDTTSSRYRSKKRVKARRGGDVEPPSSSSCSSNGDLESNLNVIDQHLNSNVEEELGLASSSIQGRTPSGVEGCYDPYLGAGDVNSQPSTSNAATSEDSVQVGGVELDESNLFFDASVLDYPPDVDVSSGGYDPFCSSATAD